ncbi:MAG: SRPBCC family protein [Actinobacteria bacterium]|nr:SRPBCC family protein [Actinomycetota bacterium]
MNRFSVTIESEDVVAGSRSQVWAILTDPDRLAQLVPRLDRVETDGDRWSWVLRGFRVLGLTIEPSFTERMTFDPETTIRFEHAPPQGARENAGASGEYRLRDAEGGTHVAIRIQLHVDLPLPLVAGGAVRAVMRREVDRMGDGFAAGLRRELASDRSA